MASAAGERATLPWHTKSRWGMADSVGRGRKDARADGAPRVALVSGWDTLDPRAWSGVVVPLRAALENALPVTTLRVTGADHPVDRALARWNGARGHGYLPEHALATARRRGRALRRMVEEADVDVVVAVACSTAVATAHLDLPVVQVTDATVRALTNYYPQFTGLSRGSLWQAERLERAAQRASAKSSAVFEQQDRRIGGEVGIAHRGTKKHPTGRNPRPHPPHPG